MISKKKVGQWATLVSREPAPMRLKVCVPNESRQRPIGVTML